LNQKKKIRASKTPENNSKTKITDDQIPKIIKIKFLNKVCIPFKENN